MINLFPVIPVYIYAVKRWAKERHVVSAETSCFNSFTITMNNAHGRILDNHIFSTAKDITVIYEMKYEAFNMELNELFKV